MSTNLTENAVAASIASTIADYRDGAITKPSADHVLKWAGQFDANVRLALLAEMDHVLKRVYVSRSTAESFLGSIAGNKKLVGSDPKAFWENIGLLRIQRGGRSQADLLSLFEPALQERCGLSCDDCDGTSTFIYLDDGLFSGNRILNDLRAWIASDAPATATVHVIVMALHTGGWHYARTRLEEAAAAAEKKITFEAWRAIELEDRKNHVDHCDVLRPRVVPSTAEVDEYIKALTDAGYPPVLRTSEGRGPAEIFSSEAGRNLLEQQFLLSGAAIRRMCPMLPDNARPLGYQVLRTLGFGSLLVTYRNCPNNAPLALWAGSPWYPLFRRRTN